jgi:hypothetical protein
MPVKMCKRVSSNTTEVRGVPSSPEVFEHFTNFQQNHAQQRAGLMPSHWCGEGEWGTTNASGRAAVLGGTGSAFGGGENAAPRKLPGSVDI